MDVVRSENNQLKLGFCTKSLFGSTNIWKLKETAALDFKTGDIWYGGAKLFKGKEKIEQKKIVELEVDMIGRRANWRYLVAKEYVQINSIVALPV